ncbi:hypothetical protein V6N11_053935 [Hibiscus sabdariffa]|uniref:Reverse transcriptase zinc-binding domain-containing protein n=1 Tax=Hibiscus sabdariffa TaxID=183260 RepID=A0ABR2S2C1_9ROSI
MDRLGHSIVDAVDSNVWLPYRFTKNGSPLSHLFFADDLVLYAKTNIEQARQIVNILNCFGSSSGHRVSVRKSQVLFSPNTPGHLKSDICAILDFDMVESFDDLVVLYGALYQDRGRHFSLIWHGHWGMVNGESVNFFSDIWVPALGPLSDYSQIPASAMSQISFASVLNEHGEWDVAKLSEVFTMNAVPYILGIKPPDTQSGPDMCVWRWTDHHDFVLKSAYYKCSQPILEMSDPLWKHIWSLQVSQRIPCFLWITCRQKLMTNLERCKLQLTDDPHCPLCHREVESILHTLRDCVYLRQYWRRIVPQAFLNTFFSSSVQGWLRQNLHSNILFCTNLPWKLVFSSILWHTWKNRNEAVFNGSSSTFEQVLSRGITWANYYNDGWLKGALVSHPTTTPSPWSNAEPGCIRKFWHRAWFINLTWTPRSGNIAADKLARLANCSSFELSFFSSPPLALGDILSSDALVVTL